MKMIDEIKEYLTSAMGYIEGSKIYLPSVEHCMLVEYDTDTGQQTVLGDLCNEIENRPLRAMGVMKTNSSLYFILRDTYQVFEYSFPNQKFYVYGESEVLFERKKHQAGAFLHNEKIWIFPFSIDETIRTFHISTHFFEDAMTIRSILDQKGYTFGKNVYISHPICHNGHVWFVLLRTSCICSISLEDGTVSVWYIDPAYILSGIEINTYGYCLVMADEGKDNVCIWDPPTNKVTEYRIDHIKQDTRRRYFRAAIPYQKKIFVIPLEYNTIVVLDKDTQQQIRLEYPDAFRLLPHCMNRTLFWGYTIAYNKIYLYPCAGNGILLIHMETNEITFIETDLSETSIQKYTLGVLRSLGRCYENLSFGLTNYISNLDILQKEGNSITKNTVGDTIYLHMLQPEQE